MFFTIQGRSIVRTGSYSECEQSRKIIKVSVVTSDPIHNIATF